MSPLTFLRLGIIFFFIGYLESSGNDKVGYAPPEAFESGSIFPYYGSSTKKGFIENVFEEESLPLYKRASQNQIFNMIRGRTEEAALNCRTLQAENPDDHDCATNDVFMGPYRDKPSWKMSLFHLFKQNWNNPAYGDEDWPGTWFRFNIADVDFFMLDGRFYRTNPHAENPTMLGPVQKAWLLKQLKNSEATFKVIVSPVPWSFEAKENSLDTWNGYRKERGEVFQFLSEYEIEGVVLLSADRHRSDVWRIERSDGYSLYEFESSRLTNEGSHGLMPGLLFGYNEKQSFGLLAFDTTQPDPAITYNIYSIDDELIYSLKVKRSELEDRQKGL